MCTTPIKDIRYHFRPLFGLYIDQLETHLQHHAQDAPELQGQNVSILLYADDIVLLSRSPAGLPHSLHVLQLFCGDKLVNTSKTQVVIFNDFRHSHADSFWCGGQALQIVNGWRGSLSLSGLQCPAPQTPDLGTRQESLQRTPCWAVVGLCQLSLTGHALEKSVGCHCQWPARCHNCFWAATPALACCF